jgi:hypothetical protein
MVLVVECDLPRGKEEKGPAPAGLFYGRWVLMDVGATS